MSTILDEVHITPAFGLLFVRHVFYVQELFGYQTIVTLLDITGFEEHKHVAAFLVYVDDFLAAGP